MKLKIGDKVRLKKDTFAFAEVKPGEIGIITEVRSDTNFNINKYVCHIEFWDLVESSEPTMQKDEDIGWGFE